MIYSDILKSISEYYRPGKQIVILEIGVGCKAYSTRAFLEGLAYRKLRFNEVGGELFSIDINKNAEGQKRHTEIMPSRFAQIIGVDKNWTFIEGDSKEIQWEKEIDILFIDGDHDYEGVKRDFEKYFPFVKKGGLILLHDVLFRRFGVREFWKEIKYPKVILFMDKAGLGIIQK